MAPRKHGVGVRFAVTLLLAFLASCATADYIEDEECVPAFMEPNKCPELPLQIDLARSNITEEQIQEAVDAIELYTDFEPCCSVDVFELVDSGGSVVITEKDVAGSFVGYASWHWTNGIVVSCDVSLESERWVVEVLIHELLHCTGISVHDDPDEYPRSIMTSSLDTDQTVLPHHINHLLYCAEFLGVHGFAPNTETVYGEDAISFTLEE